MAQTDITTMLYRLPDGGRLAFDELLEAVYVELRRIARGQLRRERREHTLSATGLVHEAWLRLVGHRARTFENRAHFFGAASQAMRRVLVDHARGRSARKRDGERVALTSLDEAAGTVPPMHELLAVHAALDGLSAVNDRVVRVVECRYFAGLTIPETAEALGISHATVSEDWRFARAWLHRTLRGVAQEQVGC
jgi:RNA polymerase sigma factor (TIGR02999 family)